MIVQDIKAFATVPEDGTDHDNGLDRHVAGIIGALIGDDLKDVLAVQISADEFADMVDMVERRQRDR